MLLSKATSGYYYTFSLNHVYNFLASYHSLCRRCFIILWLMFYFIISSYRKDFLFIACNIQGCGLFNLVLITHIFFFIFLFICFVNIYIFRNIRVQCILLVHTYVHFYCTYREICDFLYSCACIQSPNCCEYVDYTKFAWEILLG